MSASQTRILEHKGHSDMKKIDHRDRARKAWPYLTDIAKQRTTITYGALAAKIGLHHRALRLPLGVIQEYCRTNELPPLQAVVVNQQTGMPGEGYRASSRQSAVHRHKLDEVYAHEWSTRVPF
jgi:putative restriction endonuclease